MLRISLLSLVFLCATIGASPAVPHCNEPYAPQIPDGRTATSNDMNSARRDARAFIAASDVYQQCLLGGPSTMRRESLIDENQNEKERIGRAFNAAIAAFNANHTEQLQLSSR